MNQDMLTLQFDRIISLLQQNAVSQAAKDRLSGIAPILNEALCKSRMQETTAARNVLDALGSPPLAVMEGLEEALLSAVQGGMLEPIQLTRAARFSASVRALKRYLLSAAVHSAGISSYRTELPELDEMEEEILRCIREDAILDDASPALRDLRRSRERAEQNIREKLNQVILRQKHLLTDSYITVRNGRFVVPVQRKMIHAFSGAVVDASAKGGTVFMEPAAVSELQHTLDQISLDIDAEERRILYTLSDQVAQREEDIRRAMAAMTDLDVLFAKARFSAALHGREVELTGERRIRLIGARHPLMERESCVPLDFMLEAPDLGMAITGPNTGGKTVCLKTVGLLCMMAQSGLHIPCGEGSVVGLTDGVFCDIGDSQSISQNLSTFSGHMTNVIRILQTASRDSLVLLDEPGGGTDPAEGSGLAMAILEDLMRRECFFVITTHDPQIKQWAGQTEHVVSARMAFDRESFSPLYRLEIGLSGESCAIEIANRLGLEASLLRRARQIVDFGVTAKALPDGRHRYPASKLRRLSRHEAGEITSFEMGDSVALLPGNQTAIVYQPADREGNVVIQLQGEKMTVRYNRLKLLVPASELYPPDYDFSIIFDTVANRKAAHQMSRKYSPDSVIVHREGKE